jgi:hypothetical protein
MEYEPKYNPTSGGDSPSLPEIEMIQNNQLPV